MLLCFDFGTKSIGVAVGSRCPLQATPLTALYTHEESLWREISGLLKTWKPSQLIVGLPLNMNGTEQAISRLARRFAERLAQQSGLHVLLQDERLSTAAAKSRIFEQHGSRALKKGAIDANAAAIILNDFLQQQKTEVARILPL